MRALKILEYRNILRKLRLTGTGNHSGVVERLKYRTEYREISTRAFIGKEGRFRQRFDFHSILPLCVSLPRIRRGPATRRILGTLWDL